MTIHLRQLPRLLKVVTEFEYDTKIMPLREKVQLEFNNLPVLEATYPNFMELEEFCINSRILLHEDKLLKMGPLGKQIMDFGLSDFDFNQKQLDFIAKNCFLEGKYSELILEKISKFNVDKKNNYWYPSDKVLYLFNNHEVLPLLYECKILELKNDKVYLNSTYSTILKPKIEKFVPKKPKITQSQIDAQLINSKMIGEIGEEIILLYEKKRLKELGCMNEANKVELLSKSFANAGYDINSFNGKSKNLEYDRFIEVKSSVSKQIDFHWSDNEINMAQQLKNQYWLYFVPEINSETRKSQGKIEKIQNPFKNVFENSSYDKIIESYHIQKSDE